MKVSSLIPMTVVWVALLLGPSLAEAKKSRSKNVSLFSPQGYIQPGSPMYDFGEVRIQGKKLTGGFAACEESLWGRVVSNGEPVDIVAFNQAYTDEYCEGQMQITKFPRIEYFSSGVARLSGMFVVELLELGCTYGLEGLSTSHWGRHLEVSMTNGKARLLSNEHVHGSCPRKVGATFDIFGAYDGPQMFPFQRDSRTQL